MKAFHGQKLTAGTTVELRNGERATVEDPAFSKKYALKGRLENGETITWTASGAYIHNFDAPCLLDIVQYDEPIDETPFDTDHKGFASVLVSRVVTQRAYIPVELTYGMTRQEAEKAIYAAAAVWDSFPDDCEVVEDNDRVYISAELRGGGLWESEVTV